MKTSIVIFGISALAFGFLKVGNAETNKTPQTNKNDILEQWKEMDKTVTKMAGSAIKMVLPQMMEIVNDLNISSQCVKQSMQLISGLKRLKLWAFKFVDASTKMIDGIFSGTFHSTGVFDECLESFAPSRRDPTVPDFRGQYCKIDIVPPLPQKSRNYRFKEKMKELDNFTGSEIINFMADRAGLLHTYPYKIALCVPEGCTPDDISQLARAIGDKNYLSTKVNYCVMQEETTLSPVQIFAIVLSCILTLLVAAGTAFEFVYVKDDITFEGFGIRLLLSFSIISNFKKLFNTKTTDEKIRSLYGMRYMSITMVVMGHSYLYPLYMMHMYQNLIYVYDMMREPMGQMIMNSHVALDTFFFLGGFLECYIVMRNTEKDKRNFSMIGFIFRRIWRTAPVYYFILLISMLTPLMGNGPNFRESIDFSVSKCKDYWWANLLFVNNFFSMENMCMVHTWFVSCDMQLFLVAVFVIFALRKSHTTGVALTILLVIISMVYTGTVTFLYDLVPGIYIVYLDKDYLGDTFTKTFANPLTHAGPYFIGILIGYIVVTSPDTKISKKAQVTGWLIAIVCAGYTMFWTALWKHYTPSILETAIYAGLYRNTWAIGVAWMTFCCVSGYGGFITEFLSWDPWIPLAKLSFLIYLIQPTMQTMYIAVFKATQEYTHYEMITIYFGLLMMSGIFALFLNLLIESPLIAIERLFRGEKQVIEIETITNTDKYTNGDINVDLKNGLELNDFSGYMDNKAFDPTL